MDGNVMFLNNNLLCYENTINWKDILTGENSEVMHHRSSRDMTRECKHYSSVHHHRYVDDDDTVALRWFAECQRCVVHLCLQCLYCCVSL